jgi:hypothetical protein
LLALGCTRSVSTIALSEKQLVGWILVFIPIAKPERIEKCLPLLHLVRGNLHPDDDSPVVCPVVAVVEEADIPVGTDAASSS